MTEFKSNFKDKIRGNCNLFNIDSNKGRERQEIIIHFIQTEGREVKHQCHLHLKQRVTTTQGMKY